ncbi:pyruvate dehydrogenase (acetyl-transferring) E1 component subunit alpha [Pseudokordiimonas caeni]|uniref:pyruvate dehydrogenase (acetyl-transferring) E1 component subunit alpha n=1 Tax=Pseudokordiimonas caeni TaxID=2997908 RepID=UPI00281137ED|nr:pyruvate dehydrogenase (acetyl-transferring) E1 component subunit alpha [Pseudokordiimonas caeni]
MPRARMKELEPIEILSVLDEDGNFDKELAPDIADEKLIAIFRAMAKARLFDERLLNLQRQGKLGTFAPVRGQEAAQVGAVAAIEASDWLVPSFRETAAMLWRGASLEDIFIFTAGYNEGLAIPDDSNDLPTCVPVASQLPHAVGIAYAQKYRQTGSVVMAFFGDGATSEGDFHEALNFAGVFEVPVVFVCQNNQWAISVPRAKQTRAHSLAQKAIAYGFPGIQVDGNDVLAVLKAARDAVTRAREDCLPTLIECVTYRMGVHTTADDPTVYRDEEEVEEWEDRDPIERLRLHMRSRGLLDDKAEDAMAEELKDEIESAWKSARDTMEGLTDPSMMFDHLFAEPTTPLRAQRNAFEALRDDRKAANE